MNVKTALVTGGTSGIGLAAAKALAEKAKKKEEEEAAPAEEAPAEPSVEEKTLDTLNEIKALLEKNSK